jgi:lysophospholipase L1-like esterase
MTIRPLRSAAVVALVALGLCFVPGPVFGPGLVLARPTAIVALGDSFISGEGGRWLGNGSEPLGTRSGTDRAAYDCDSWGCDYDPERVYGASEDNGCHRSDIAPIESAPAPVDVRVNLACSGAKASDLWPAALGGTSHFGEPPQADALATVAKRDEVRMVVVTVGANDVGFGSLVAGCALDWARSSDQHPVYCHGDAQADIEAALPAATLGIERALRGVRSAMAGDGYGRGDYRLVAMSYASPFPPGRWFRYPEDGWSRLTEGGCPVWDADADWSASDATDALAATMQAAAAATGAEFLDLRDAFDGHQLCDRRDRRVGEEGPSPITAEWFRRLSFVQGSTRESLHPNAYGQRAIGACLGLLLARPRADYTCTDTPGEFLGGMHLEATRSASVP